MSRKHRYRNAVMLVNNEQWNERFFNACQHAKDSRFMDQKVQIIAWKAFRRGGLIAQEDSTIIPLTQEMMIGVRPPTFSEYIEFLNVYDHAGINDDGEVTLSLTMELTYYAKKKATV